jgi:hypothetical protein
VPALYASGGLVGVFADAGGRSGAVRCQLCSPGGSVSCSQMPKGGLLIVWQLGASSYSSGGFVRVFADARGGSEARFPTKWLVRLFCVKDVDSSLPEYGILSVSSQSLYIVDSQLL